MTTPKTPDEWRAWLAERGEELMTATVFCTRLPLPRAAPAGSAIAEAAWAFPLAGAIVGVIGAVVYALAHRLGVPAWPAAALCVAATLATTGCLHEDGLADTADGFGGGKTREQKLEIMRDSRIGVYGACALALSILIRVSVLASLAHTGLVVAALIAAHGAARAAMPFFMYLPPARADGLSFGAGQPPRESVIGAGVIGLLTLLALGPATALAAAVLLFVAVALMARVSLWQIGGQTGDVLGALEQIGEIVVLLVAARAAG